MRRWLELRKNFPGRVLYSHSRPQGAGSTVKQMDQVIGLSGGQRRLGHHLCFSGRADLHACQWCAVRTLPKHRRDACATDSSELFEADYQHELAVRFTREAVGQGSPKLPRAAYSWGICGK